MPHPPVQTTVARLQANDALARRVIFTHFNHTNPVMWDGNAQAALRERGFGVAHDGMELKL